MSKEGVILTHTATQVYDEPDNEQTEYGQP